MTWETVKLGDIAEFSNGINFNKSAYINGIKFISVSDFGDRFCPLYDELSEVKKDVVKQNDLLHEGDIVFVRSNGNKELVGRCMLIKDLPEPITYSGFVIRCRFSDCSKYDPVFFTYLFKSKAFRRAMSGTAVGANIQNLSQGRLNAYTARIPDYCHQRKIADVLSAYDDLIENNQKQIKLLEEAAQRLYKEWFVDFRFPGHETTSIINGLPEGWRIGTLDEVAIDSGKIEKKENRNNFNYYLPIDCLPKESLAYTTTDDISLAESSLISFAPGDILFGAMRPYFHKVVVARDYGLTRSTCFVINTKVDILWSYLIMLLFSKETINYATKISVGTTMPYVRWKDFINMNIVIPPQNILVTLDRLIKPIIKKTILLAKGIMNFTQARDRLLPKLMSEDSNINF